MLEDKKIMLPPWLACPKIERFSIGWRMGYGEDYMLKWDNWYHALSDGESKEYRELFPEPPTWKGFWKDDDECACYTHGKFCIEFWQKDGIPKYSLAQLQQEYRAGRKMNYCMFWKTHPDLDGSIGKGCFSQWQHTPFYSAASEYCSMEQFMMAQKARLFGDNEILQQILSCKDPRKIKSLGQKVRNFDETIWGKVKYSIVLNGNYMKFSQNPGLKAFLLQTGDDILVEASPYDGIWGIKMAETDENAHNPLKWRGQNLLGFALMEVRDVLREVCQNEHLAPQSQS